MRCPDDGMARLDEDDLCALAHGREHVFDLRHALARINLGYAMSKLPFEQMTLKLRFFSVPESVIGFS